MAERTVLKSDVEKQNDKIIVTETVERRLGLKDLNIMKQDYESRISDVDSRIARFTEQRGAIQIELDKINSYIQQLQ